MFLNLLRQVQEEALSREIAKRKLPNEVRNRFIDEIFEHAKKSSNSKLGFFSWVINKTLFKVM